MKICDILARDKIIPSLKSTNKESAINELIDVLKSDERIIDADRVKEAVLEREKIMSTGVGKNFAIPHGKTDSVKQIIAAFGIARTPIDFNSPDGEPVYLIFLLVGKDNLVGPHIKLLSRISRMMNKDEFRENLLKAKTAEEIYTVFEEEERNYFDIS